MKAVVLCAGLGTRLRPFTNLLPKPLLPVLNRPLLDWILGALGEAGYDTFGLNFHHLPELLEAHLAGSPRPPGPGEAAIPPRLMMVREPEILGTGGGVAHFRELMNGEEAFLVHNGDVLADFPLAAIRRAHLESGALGTLVLVEREDTDAVLCHADGTILDIRGRLGSPAPAGARCFEYSGVACYHPRIFDYLTPGRPASILEVWQGRLEEEPGVLRGFVVPRDGYWNDLGTVGSYLGAHRDLLSEGGPFLVHPTARVDSAARLEGWAAIGPECVVEAGAVLEECVLWAGTRVKAGARWRRALLAGDLAQSIAG